MQNAGLTADTDASSAVWFILNEAWSVTAILTQSSKRCHDERWCGLTPLAAVVVTLWA